MSSTAVLITAAGKSTRLGLGEKKEYYVLKGKTVLQYAIDAFMKAAHIDSFVITLPEEDIREQEKRLPFLKMYSNISLVPGGSTRQESVKKGLEALADSRPDIVLIHDGARPWVSPSIISRVIDGVKTHSACIPVIKTVDAVKLLDENGFITQDLEREKTVGAQTPQGFVYSDILKAHHHAANDGREFIDDGGIFGAYIGPVFTVPGELSNTKITYKKDLGL